jgi:predicted lipoprotein with Yx(FWY)xxD motif
MTMKWMDKIRSLGVVWAVMVAVVTLAACGRSASTAAAAGGSSADSTPTVAGVVVSATTIAGAGTVLVDGTGFALYTLGSEASGTIQCTETCAAKWPPLLLSDGTTSATAGSGVSASDLGTIARPDAGTQVTYKGLPLYLWVGDESPGQVTGQGVAGFSVAKASGQSSPNPSASSSASSRYGY